MIAYFGAGPAGWSAVESLAQLVSARRTRSSSDDLTLFKSLGMGISDLSLGIELYRRAVSSGTGHEFAHPKKSAPRLRAAEPLNTSTGV